MENERDYIGEVLTDAQAQGHPVANRAHAKYAELRAENERLREALQWALDDPDSEILGEQWEQAARAALAGGGK